MLDFALIAEVAYCDYAEARVLVDEFFPQRGFKIVKCFGDVKCNATSPGLDTMPNSKVKGYVIHSATHNLDVMSVRGTDVGHLEDAVQDMKLWAEAVILQLFRILSPFTIGLWPHDFVSSVIEWISNSVWMFGIPAGGDYYHVLLDHIIDHKERNEALPPRKRSSMYVTGHSLGGGIAHIVGGLTDTAAVGFSPPGVLLSRRTHKLTRVQQQRMKGSSSRVTHRDSERLWTGIVPSTDVVPMADVQTGLTQTIQCDDVTAGPSVNPVSCHMLEHTICELFKACDDEKWNRFHGCEYDFGNKIRHFDMDRSKDIFVRYISKKAREAWHMISEILEESAEMVEDVTEVAPEATASQVKWSSWVFPRGKLKEWEAVEHRLQVCLRLWS